MKAGNFHPPPPNTHQLQGILGHWPFWCKIKMLCAWILRSRVQIYLPSPQLTKLATNIPRPTCLHSSNSLYMTRVTFNGRLQLLAYPHRTSKHEDTFPRLALQLQTQHHQRSFDLSDIQISDENCFPLNTWMTHLLYLRGNTFCLQPEDMLGCGKKPHLISCKVTKRYWTPLD